MKIRIVVICLVLGVVGFISEVNTGSAAATVDVTTIKDIKAYCIDFNWGARRRFARPGSWATSDPAQHVAWYKSMGVNVIQACAVSECGLGEFKRYSS